MSGAETHYRSSGMYLYIGRGALYTGRSSTDKELWTVWKSAWQGICLGIKEDGALLVQREDGKVEEVIAGEVSVRGIYGYV